MADVNLPGIPGIDSKVLNEDPQLKDLLIAIKLTLETLTGADTSSNSALIDLLNDNQ